MLKHVLAALTILAVPPAYLLADEPARIEAEYFPRPTVMEERILAALEQTTHMNFTESPLQGVVDYLKDLHKIEIQLDTKTLADKEIFGDVPITGAIKGVSLKSALNLLLLRNLNLAYTIKDEVLLITTKDKVDTEVITRTYPVADLIDESDSKPYANLIQAIVSTVKPITWTDAGGFGTILDVWKTESLVISHTREAHDQVLALLRAQRSAQKISEQRAATRDKR